MFTEGNNEVVSLFSEQDTDDNDGLGVEALAPPLPAPPPAMSPEAAERLSRAVNLLQHTSENLAAEMSATALEIAVLVARKILEAEVKADPELAQRLVKAAVRRLGDTHKVTIRLSPTDAEIVRASASANEGLAATFGVAKVELIADTNLTPGDCIVDSDAASVDGRLGTRVEELRRVLESAIHEELSTS